MRAPCRDSGALRLVGRGTPASTTYLLIKGEEGEVGGTQNRASPS